MKVTNTQGVTVSQDSGNQDFTPTEDIAALYAEVREQLGDPFIGIGPADTDSTPGTLAVLVVQLGPFEWVQDMNEAGLLDLKAAVEKGLEQEPVK